MNNSQKLLFELLLVCTGKKDSLEKPYSEEQWFGALDIANEQALPGILLSALEKLPKEQLPPQTVLLQWIGLGQMIEQQNKLLNRKCSELVKKISADGYRSCLLKGQGNAIMYPDSYRRTTGDIDIWIEGGKKRIVEYVHKLFPDISIQYHHMDFPIFEDVEVEAHYFPSFSYNKIYNKRLQNYFEEKSKEQFDNYVLLEGAKISIPTVPFNIVFQLSHMMRHFFTQGLGLRHAVDFYYLLFQPISEEDMKETVAVIKRCGMYKFLCAMMYIERSIFSLQKNIDIAPANEKAGKMVLNEMMKGGYFGKSFDHNKGNVLWMFIKQIAYRLGYIMEFPSEPLWRPIAHIWDHFENRFIWKKM